MNQDEAKSGDERPLEQAVEQQDQALQRVKDIVDRPGVNAEELRTALEDGTRRAEQAKRELGRQDVGTLPKAREDTPEPPPQEPIGGLG